MWFVGVRVAAASRWFPRWRHVLGDVDRRVFASGFFCGESSSSSSPALALPQNTRCNHGGRRGAEGGALRVDECVLSGSHRDGAPPRCLRVWPCAAAAPASSCELPRVSRRWAACRSTEIYIAAPPVPATNPQLLHPYYYSLTTNASRCPLDAAVRWCCPLAFRWVCVAHASIRGDTRRRRENNKINKHACTHTPAHTRTHKHT